jgi:uracil-DNA glycosylase family 4
MTHRSLPMATARPSLAPIDVWPPLPPDENRAERERLLAALQSQMAMCRLCVDGGYLERASSIAGFRGRIGDRILLVGQAPGHLSVERGLPFSGPGGRVLEIWLARAGLPAGALRSEVYISALTKCDPGKNARGDGDRKPSPPELALCRPHLLRELELVRPWAILLVGGMAIDAFLGPSHLEDVVGTSVERNDVHLLPLPHPSGVSRWLNDPGHQALLARALALLAGWRREWERKERDPGFSTESGLTLASEA